MVGDAEATDHRDMGPAEGRDVGDGIVAASEPRMVRQPSIEYGESAFRQAPIVFDRRWHLLFGEHFKMDALAENWSHARCMELQPFDRLPPGLGISWEQLVGLVGEIEQDGGRLEQDDARVVIRDDRDAAMRGQGEKRRLPMLSFFDVHMVEAVRQSQLFKGDCRLETVGGRIRVKVDQCTAPRAGTGAPALSGLSLRVKTIRPASTESANDPVQSQV